MNMILPTAFFQSREPDRFYFLIYRFDFGGKATKGFYWDALYCLNARRASGVLGI